MMLLEEYHSPINSRILEAEAVRVEASKDLPKRTFDLLKELIPAGKVIHYGSDASYGTESIVKSSFVQERIVSPLISPPRQKLEETGGNLYRAVLGIAVSAQSPAQLDNALGFLVVLEECRNKIEYAISQNKLLCPSPGVYKNSDFLKGSIASFVNSHRAKDANFEGSVEAESLSVEIKTLFRSYGGRDVTGFLTKLESQYFGNSAEEVNKAAVEAYLLLVLGSQTDPSLKISLLTYPSRLGFGKGNDPKPIFARDTTYWSTVHANWAYPQINLGNVGIEGLREKEFEQKIFDLEALVQILQAGAEKSNSLNERQNVQIGKLEAELARLRGAKNVAEPTGGVREREPWKIAAQKYGLDPNLLTAEQAGIALGAFRRMYAKKFHPDAAGSDASATEQLKSINSDLDLIAKHFDIK